jgi:hypothetical protein
MPAASPRRQALPVDMTLTSARTTKRRCTLTALGSRHGHLGSSQGLEEKAPATETVVSDMDAVAGLKKSDDAHCRRTRTGRRQGPDKRMQEETAWPQGEDEVGGSPAVGEAGGRGLVPTGLQRSGDGGGWSCGPRRRRRAVGREDARAR